MFQLQKMPLFTSVRELPWNVEEFQIKRAETLLDWGLLPHLGKHPENRKERAQFLEKQL